MSESPTHQRPAPGQALGFGWLGAIHAAGTSPDGTPLAIRSLAIERLAEVGRLAQLMAFAAHHPHPHVLEVSTLRSDERGVYYLMPRALGGSLRGVFERYRAAGANVEAETMLDVARQIAEALDAAHSRGVLHGNLKPENVLLQPLSAPKADEFRLLVSDFGLNSLRPPDPHSPYLPAPQRAGAATTLESDLYAIGAILFEGLSGRALPPQPLQADLLDIPEPAARVIARCLGLSAPFADMTAFLGYLRALQVAGQTALGQVQLSADHSYLDAIPGETQNVRIKVNSAVAQRVQLALEGLPAEWTPALPAVTLQPGVDALVTLRLLLPRRASMSARQYDAHIVALAQLDSQTSINGQTPINQTPINQTSSQERLQEKLELARLPLRIRVQPFEHSLLRLTALPTVARTTTTITANLSNQGNQSLLYNLEINLPAGSRVQRGSLRRQLELAPGAEFSEILDVRLPTPGLSSRPLTVTALANSASLPSNSSIDADTAAPASWLPTYNTVEDHLLLEQRPLIPWWGLALAAAGLLGLGTWAARPPEIQDFRLQGGMPAQGAPFTLTWNTTGARQVQISELPDQSLGSSGQVRLQGLNRPATYTLVASGLFSQRKQQITVTPALPAPRINTFKVTPSQAFVGQTVRVEWNVQHAASVQLSPFGTVPASGVRELVMERNTPLQLVARKGAQPSAADVASKVTVTLRPPKIETFTISPSSAVRGQAVTLRWQVSGAKVVRLAPLGDLPASGSRTLSATQNTNYTLKASNGQQETTASVGLTVRVPQAKIEALTITPSVLQVGQTVRVQWRSQNATRAQLRWGEREQVVAPSGDITLKVTPDMQAFTLVAENPNGEPAMLTRRMQVRAAPVGTPALDTATPATSTPATSTPATSTPATSVTLTPSVPATTAPKPTIAAPSAPTPSVTVPSSTPKPSQSSTPSQSSKPVQATPVRVQTFAVQTAGGVSRLRWQVSGAASVNISGLRGPNADGSFPASGTVTVPVNPQIKTYVLSAAGQQSRVQVPATPASQTGRTTVTPTKPQQPNSSATSRAAPRYPGITGNWNHSFGQLTLNEAGGRVSGSLLSSRADLPSGNLSGRLSGDEKSPTLNAFLQEGDQRVALIIRFDLNAQTFEGLYASRSARVPWCGWKGGAANPCP